MTPATRIALISIVAVAAALRLYDLAHTQFRHDDETMFYLASQAVRHWLPPIAGMESSIGIPHGPLAVYLLMLPVGFGGSELAALWFVGVLNVVAVALTYVAMRRFVDEHVALLAALLMATNPWFVVYSRRLWLNAVLPLFSIVFLWALLRLVERADLRRGSVVVAALAFAALVQIHLGAIAHLYTAIVAVLLLRLWRHPRAARAGFIVVLAALTPYTVFVVAPRVVRIAADSLRDPTTVAGWPVSVADGARMRAFLELLTSHGYQAYATHAADIVDTRRGVFLLADAVLLAAFVVGAIVVARRAWRSTGGRRHVDLLLLTFVAAPVVFPAPAPRLPTFQHIFPFYLLVTAPALFLLAGEGFVAAARALGRVRPALGLVPAGAAVGIAALHVVAAGPFFASIGAYWPRADYGLPLAETRRLTDTLVAKAGGAPIVIAGHDEVAEAAYRALQRRGAEVAYVDDRSVLPLLPNAGALYVTTTDDGWTRRALVERTAAREQERFHAAGRHWTARLFWLDGATAGELLSNRVRGAPMRVDDLAVIYAVHVMPAGSSAVVLDVTWRLERPPRELAVAQIVRASAPPNAVPLSEAAILPTDARPEDGLALTRFVYLQRFPIALASAPGQAPMPIAFRLVTRWGRRPLTSAVTLGILSVPAASRPRLDSAPSSP